VLGDACGIARARQDILTVLAHTHRDLRVGISEEAHGLFLSSKDRSAASTRLRTQGVVHEFPGPILRYSAIAQDYTQTPSRTLVLSSSGESRTAITLNIRRLLRERSLLGPREFPLPQLVYVPHFGPDRIRDAKQYGPGDTLRVCHSSKSLGIAAGDYLSVVAVDKEAHLLTVLTPAGEPISYDPALVDLNAVLYRTEHRLFSEGDRVQFTAPWPERDVAFRQLGVIESLDDSGNLLIRLDQRPGAMGPERLLFFPVESFKHLDYGYVVPALPSLGWRLLLHAEPSHPDSMEMICRAAAVTDDLTVYTSDREAMLVALSQGDI
jgi:hypothetical protein